MRNARLIRSMSRKGCSPDNAACEGFFGRLKTELFYTRTDVRRTTRYLSVGQIYLQDNPLLERHESRNHFASKPSSLISDYASRCQELVLASQEGGQITRHTWALLA